MQHNFQQSHDGPSPLGWLSGQVPIGWVEMVAKGRYHEDVFGVVLNQQQVLSSVRSAAAAHAADGELLTAAQAGDLTGTRGRAQIMTLPQICMLWRSRARQNGDGLLIVRQTVGSGACQQPGLRAAKKGCWKHGLSET